MKQKINHKIVHMPIAELKMYKRNARTHSGEQVKRIAESIQEFGFLNPILLDSATKEIIAGHGRLLAARELGLETVPVVVYSHLTDTQKKAYTLADNKLALDAGWDDELLKLELEELKLEDFDLDIIGFGDFDFSLNLPEDDDLKKEDKTENPYSQKTDSILYQPSQDKKPEISELYDDHKTNKLLIEIEQSHISSSDKEFLIKAAHRHTVFNYKNIAEYYCHSNKDVQQLMQKSALIILDFDYAIKEGYIKLSQTLNEIYEDDNSETESESEDDN